MKVKTLLVIRATILPQNHARAFEEGAKKVLATRPISNQRVGIDPSAPITHIML